MECSSNGALPVVLARTDLKLKGGNRVSVRECLLLQIDDSSEEQR